MHETGNPNLLAYSKTSDDGSDVVLMVVNLDTVRWQEATLTLDLAALGVDSFHPYTVQDLLTGRRLRVAGRPNPYVRLDPADAPAHVFSVTRGPVH